MSGLTLYGINFLTYIVKIQKVSKTVLDFRKVQLNTQNRSGAYRQIKELKGLS